MKRFHAKLKTLSTSNFGYYKAQIQRTKLFLIMSFNGGFVEDFLFIQMTKVLV